MKTQKEKIAGYDTLSQEKEMVFLALNDVLENRVHWIKKGKLGIIRWNSNPLVITYTAYWYVEDLHSFHKYWSEYYVPSSKGNEDVIEWRNLAVSVRSELNKLLDEKLHEIK